MVPVMIVPVLKFYDKLQNMLDTVDYPIDHILIFDNGGKLKSLKCNFANKISIINFPSNVGVPTTWNLGIKLEPYAKYWLFSQDDIIWNKGGLEEIHSKSTSDNICIDMKGQRPFSSFSVGENVIEKVGLFDESYFPLVGDDFNFHKRCHFYNIEETDISGTFIAEKSASIQDLAKSGVMSMSVFEDNLTRSIVGPPVISKWSLMKRRTQGIIETNTDQINMFVTALNSNYKIHNNFEMNGFNSNLEVNICESCSSRI